MRDLNALAWRDRPAVTRRVSAVVGDPTAQARFCSLAAEVCLFPWRSQKHAVSKPPPHGPLLTLLPYLRDAMKGRVQRGLCCPAASRPNRPLIHGASARKKGLDCWGGESVAKRPGRERCVPLSALITLPLPCCLTAFPHLASYPRGLLCSLLNGVLWRRFKYRVASGPKRGFMSNKAARRLYLNCCRVPLLAVMWRQSGFDIQLAYMDLYRKETPVGDLGFAERSGAIYRVKNFLFPGESLRPGIYVSPLCPAFFPGSSGAAVRLWGALLTVIAALRRQDCALLFSLVHFKSVLFLPAGTRLSFPLLMKEAWIHAHRPSKTALLFTFYIYIYNLI